MDAFLEVKMAGSGSTRADLRYSSDDPYQREREERGAQWWGNHLRSWAIRCNNYDLRIHNGRSFQHVDALFGTNAPGVRICPWVRNPCWRAVCPNLCGSSSNASSRGLELERTQIYAEEGFKKECGTVEANLLCTRIFHTSEILGWFSFRTPTSAP